MNNEQYTIIDRTYAETGFLNQNSEFYHFIPTPNPVSWLVGVSPD